MCIARLVLRMSNEHASCAARALAALVPLPMQQQLRQQLYFVDAEDLTDTSHRVRSSGALPVSLHFWAGNENTKALQLS